MGIMSKYAEARSSVSGTDCDVYVQEAGEWEQVGTMQGMSMRDKGDYARGSMSALVMDKSTFRRGQILDRIVIQYMDEFGNAAHLELRYVKITVLGTGVSIDDITTDDNMEYIALESSGGWIKGQRIRRTRNGIQYLETGDEPRTS